MNRTRGAPTDFAYTPASKKRRLTTMTSGNENDEGSGNLMDDVTDNSNTMDNGIIKYFEKLSFYWAIII